MIKIVRDTPDVIAEKQRLDAFSKRFPMPTPEILRAEKQGDLVSITCKAKFSKKCLPLKFVVWKYEHPKTDEEIHWRGIAYSEVLLSRKREVKVTAPYTKATYRISTKKIGEDDYMLPSCSESRLSFESVVLE